ncbi:hypothetical protein COC45_03825 [Bacillus cereus]|nr:hypothetical protein COJ40_26775 [Bacillus cereus]PGS16323.1 hypothetical protein COC45_03825 [Bacillus cereus]
MNLVGFLWKHKEKVVCSLNSIICDNKFNIKLRLDFNDETNQTMYNTNLVLMNRKNKEELIYPLKQEHSLGYWNLVGDINFKSLFKTISCGIWDAYVLLESEQGSKKYRIKNLTSEFPEIIGLNDYVICPYTTVKGNLSFKCEMADGISKLESCYLNEEGQLCLDGYSFIPGLDISSKNTKKQIVIQPEDDIKEYYLSCKNVKRKDITKKYRVLEQNYDGSGFSITIDLHEELKKIENKPFKIFIDLEFKTDKNEVVKKRIPFKDEGEIIDRLKDGEFFETHKGVRKLSLNTDPDTSELIVYINNLDLHAEAKVIYAENNRIDIYGEFILTKNTIVNLDGENSLMIKKRFVDVYLHLPIEIEDTKFSCSIDIEKLTLKDELREGIWDLYVRINGENYRLATCLDEIKDKQKCMVFPQQIAPNSINKALAIKPYYTLHNEVSILIRNYIFHKNVQGIFISPNEMKLIGKINIMKTTEERVPECTKGRVSIKGPHGIIYEIPLVWNLRPTGKTLVEFEFEASASPSYEDLPIVYKEIVKNIRFDSIECEIEFEDYISKFVLNVNPERVHVNKKGRASRKSFVKNVVEKNKETLYRVINKILPINKKIVVFQSYYGNSYACNPKAIYEEMINQNRDIKAIWIVKNLETEIVGNPIKVQPHSLKYYYYMAIAKFFVNNGNFPDFYDKRKGTVHLQTWHGTPLKKLGLDIDSSSPAYMENTSPELIRRNKRWDYLIGPNAYTSEILQRAYNFKGNMLEVGYPRNDMFYKGNNDERVSRIKKLLNIDPKKKVILYAPTWRDYEKRHEPFAFRFDLDKFQKEFGDDYVLLLRLHYFDAARVSITGYEKFVYNVTYYNDIQDLYLISDILVTDYSSVMFDYANLNRPMIFFTYDLLRYGSEIRGFYMNFKDEAPGPLVQNERELFKALRQIDTVQKDYELKYNKFREKFCHLEDGKASKRTIDAVFGVEK